MMRTPILILVLLLTAAASADVAERFGQLDRDGDGSLTRAEVDRPLLFRRFDADGDGRVTGEEVEAVLGPSSPEGVRVVRDLRYASLPGVDPSLLSLDLYGPEEPGPARPVVVMIHGGGWRIGDKAHRGSVSPKAEWLVGQGFLFPSINYRLSPDVRHPAHVEDVARALAWIHDHAREHGGDPARIFVMGHSAGAHLAALVCTDERRLQALGKDLSLVKGTILLDGAGYDLMARGTGCSFTPMFEQAFGPRGPAWVDASPVTHVSSGKGIPPFLILHTERLPSVSQSRLLGETLEEAGVPVRVVAVAGKDHAAINRDVGRPGDETTRVIGELLGVHSES